MSTRLQRFDFGALRDFRGPIVARVVQEIHVEEAPPAPPPPPVFSESDLESSRIAAQKLGYTEGFAAGRAAAEAERDQRQEDAHAAIAQLAEKIGGIQSIYQDILTRESAELSELVLAIARKVAAEALDARNVETLVALVDRCLPVIFSKPRLMVDLHPDMFETAMNRIEAHLQQHGFEGEIQFRANPAMALHDIALDWGMGHAGRDGAAIWQEIEALLQRVPLELTFADTLNKTTPTSGE